MYKELIIAQGSLKVFCRHLSGSNQKIIFLFELMVGYSSLC